MKAFEWASASTVQDAVKLLTPADPTLDPDEQPHPIAGGQDLLTAMKDYLVRPVRVVNLKTIAGLNQIKDDGKGGLAIGATVTLQALHDDAMVQSKYPGLMEAAASIGTPQIRNLGTIGGNLCQRPRCWYFRLESAMCRKKGGKTCYAALGQNKYNAIFPTGPSNIVHPSDLATMLVALGASLTIAGPSAPRTIAVEDFFVTPDDNIRKENVLKDGEIVTEIQIPAPTGRSAYVKFKERESLDFAMAAVAAVVQLGAGGTVQNARLVLGGVASIPWRVADVEKYLVGKTLSAATLEAAATQALDGALPLAQNGYKVPLTQALVKRALTQAFGGVRVHLMAKNPIVGAIIMLLFVAGLVAFGCYEYADLKQFQQEGGTRTMNSMLVLVYNIGGPAGVLVFFLLAAAVCLGAAAKTIVKRSA